MNQIVERIRVFFMFLFGFGETVIEQQETPMDDAELARIYAPQGIDYRQFWTDQQIRNAGYADPSKHFLPRYMRPTKWVQTASLIRRGDILFTLLVLLPTVFGSCLLLWQAYRLLNAQWSGLLGWAVTGALLLGFGIGNMLLSERVDSDALGIVRFLSGHRFHTNCFVWAPKWWVRLAHVPTGEETIEGTFTSQVGQSTGAPALGGDLQKLAFVFKFNIDGLGQPHKVMQNFLHEFTTARMENGTQRTPRHSMEAGLVLMREKVTLWIKGYADPFLQGYDPRWLADNRPAINQVLSAGFWAAFMPYGINGTQMQITDISDIDGVRGVITLYRERRRITEDTATRVVEAQKRLERETARINTDIDVTRQEQESQREKIKLAKLEAQTSVQKLVRELEVFRQSGQLEVILRQFAGMGEQSTMPGWVTLAHQMGLPQLAQAIKAFVESHAKTP